MHHSVGWLVGWSVGQLVGQTFEMHKMADSDVKISFIKMFPILEKAFPSTRLSMGRKVLSGLFAK